MSSIHSQNSIECQVCCSDVSSYIVCGNCKWSACTPCIQTYLLSTPTPRCMNCSSQFTEHFLRIYLQASWIDRKYKPYLKEQLFAQERNLLSQDVEVAKIYKEYIEGKRLAAKSDLTVEEAMAYISACRFRRKREADYNLISDYKAHIKRIVVDLNKLYTGYLDNNIWQPQSQNDDEKIISKKYNRPCVQPNCKGFIDENHVDGWKCAICEVVICKDCRVVKNTSTHSCDPQIIQSIKLIQEETKPCPTCAEPIFKPFGCDHMFCTVCKANFSWKTGQLIPASQQTNPLYREYMQQLSSNVSITVNNECNALTYEQFMRLDLYHVHDNVQLCSDLQNKKISNIVNLRPIIISLRDRENDVSNRFDRIKYIANEHTEGSFKTRIYANYKRSEYLRELANIKSVAQQCLMEYYVLLSDWVRGLVRKYSLLTNPSEVDCPFITVAQNPSNYVHRSFKNYYVDLNQWEHYGKHNQIIAFFNKQSIELAKLYGYSVTTAICEYYYRFDQKITIFNCKEQNIKDIIVETTII